MARLTKRMVEAAEGGDSGWRWLGDDEVPGFGAMVYPSGTKTFALRYRTHAGRQRMMKLGHFGELTVQQARDLARSEKVRVLEGQDPRAIRDRERTELRTVAQLLDRWKGEYAKTHRKTWKEDEGRIDRHIRPHLGRLHVDSLTSERVAGWHRLLGKAAPVEANRCLETPRAAWRWADRHDRLPNELRDPTKSVRRFRERSRERWLRRDELGRLLRATEKEDDPYVRAAVPLLLLTGLRKGELLSARWSNVDLERGEILLPETKSGGAQVRLLPQGAVEILRSLPRHEGNPFIFPSPGERSDHRKDFKKRWKRIRTAADLEDVTLHDLRRTAGSFMAQAGVPLQVIQQVLGHSHPSVTRLYARLSSENERNALETLADELGPTLGRKGR